MTKLKGILLLLLGALLLDFALENAHTSPSFKLFKFELGNLPIFLVVYASLGLGFIGGWLGHAIKVRRRKRAAALAVEKPESLQAPQEQQ